MAMWLRVVALLTTLHSHALAIQLQAEALLPTVQASESPCHCGEKEGPTQVGSSAAQVEVLTADASLAAQVRQSSNSVAAKIASALHIASSHVHVIPWSWVPADVTRSESALAPTASPCACAMPSSSGHSGAPARVQMITSLTSGAALVNDLRAQPAKFEHEIARLLDIPPAQVRVNPPAAQSDIPRQSLTNFTAEWLPSLSEANGTNWQGAGSAQTSQTQINRASLAFWSITFWPPLAKEHAERLLLVGNADSDSHADFQRILPSTLERVPGMEYPLFHGNGVPEAKLLPPQYSQSGTQAMNMTHIREMEKKVLQKIHAEEVWRMQLVNKVREVQQAAQRSYDVLASGSPPPELEPPAPV
eukprot:CAMPEP_0178425536 /NCGR_PEP_ID=MMETSP0689_2-20121128/28773_1 /TAXON_ID=160604 /ORGANISM="Amphidinium massartii, Strain CS-259" /LENGTH=360 /DNA_ID=CAMNT_0020047201 /DNA_START=106 /DNA_END=1184 /DNA_ORIENTATION=+